MGKRYPSSVQGPNVMSAPDLPLRRSWSDAHVWLLLVGLLVICLPQYLSMGLWADVTLHDLCARNILSGGIHYRDLIETNLPGMDWLQIIVRSVFGWDSFSIRAVDIVVFAVTVWILKRGLAAMGASRTTQAWTVFALFAFYFSTCEQCHCQRDVWMLVPALGAFTLRRRRLEQLVTGEATARQLAFGGFVEGLCWGAAIWIKPHVMLPLLACQLTAANVAWRSANRSLKRLAADGAGLLAGGLLAGVLGLAWLFGSGTWPYFVKVVQEWDTHYYEGGGEDSTFLYRLALLWDMFIPWSIMHLVAIPMAIACAWRFFRGPLAAESSERSTDTARALLAVLYLSWLVQALFFQKGYWYIRLPLIVLALPLVAEKIGQLRFNLVQGFALTAAALGIACVHPMLQPGRFAVWARCCTHPGAPDLEDRLAINPEWCAVHFSDLDHVRGYLADKHLHDGELLCYNDFTHPLYLELGLKPSGRFVHWSTMRYLFPSHAEQIDDEMKDLHPVYVVTDLRCLDMWSYLKELEAGGSDEPRLPPLLKPSFARQYPFCEPIVFRSGPYCVHRVREKTELAKRN